MVRRYVDTLLLLPYGHHVDVVYWTLTVEITFYMLVFVCIRFYSFETMMRAVLWVGILSCVLNIFAVVAQAGIGQKSVDSLFMSMWAKHTPRLLLLRHGCFFALGSVLWSRLTPHRRPGMEWLVLLLLVGGTFEVYFTARGHARQFPDAHFSMWSSTLAWLVGVVLIYSSTLPAVNSRLSSGRLPRALRTLGLLTFPLYLLHNNLGVFLRERVLAWSHSNGLGTLAGIAVSLAFAYIVSTKIDPPVSVVFREFLRRISRMLFQNTATRSVWNLVFIRRSP